MSEYLYPKDQLKPASILRRALGGVASFFGQNADKLQTPVQIFAAESRKVVDLQALLDIVVADYQEQQRLMGEKAPSSNIRLLTLTSPRQSISDTYKELTLSRALTRGDCGMYLNRQSPELPNSCETVDGLVYAPVKKLLAGVKSIYGLRSEFGKSAKEGIDAAQESLALRFYGAHLKHKEQQED